MVGRTIGKYHIVEQIGRGGMGTVYKAVDTSLDRRVAIKILNADLIDPDSVERFRREALMLAKLNHTHIGAIHELTRDGHDLVMVMEFLEGETFERLIERGPMPISRAVTLCEQVLDALEYAHRAGVIHRDLKPANVMVAPSGDIKVMDFGIARVQGSEHLTTNGFMVGTPAYMAPEQVRGEEVDPRMDLYAVAVVLYRMLTQRLPFSGDTAIAMIHSQLNNPPTPPRQFRADLPEWLVGVITKGLSKAPTDRFQTAAEFRAALERGLSGRAANTAILPADAETIGPTLTPPSMRSPSPASKVGPSAVVPAPPASSPTAPAVDSQPSSGSAEATVTLRTPQLVTAGVLVLVLIVGIGVLAFLSLRRPEPVASPATQTSAPEAPTTTATAAPAAAPEPAASPQPPTPPTAITPKPSPVASAPASPPPATSGSSTPSAATAAAAPPASSATAARPNATRPNGAAPATGAAPGAPNASAASTPAPVVPAAANAPTESFGDVRAIVVEGGKSREVDALISLEPGTLIVRAQRDGSLMRSLPYASIAAATYARARRPRGQPAQSGVAEVPDSLGGGLGGKHWLTLQTPSEFLVIRLEDRNVVRVLRSIEARTGGKIIRPQAEKE